VWSPSAPLARVALSAHRVVIAQTQSRWPGSAPHAKQLECPSLDGAPVWRPAVQALADWLSAQHPKPALHIVLSSRFTRWQLLDSKVGLSQPDEVAAYAALRFKETYGKVAEHWSLMPSPQPPGSSLPVCAVDVALLDALRHMCKEAGASLVSVAPYFSSAFDRWQSALKGTVRCFGVVETDCLSLALLGPKGFISLHSQRLDTPLYDTLPGLLVQMTVACGLSASNMPIYLVGKAPASLPAVPTGLSVQWLQDKAMSGL